MDIIDSFIDQTGDTDLPRELVSYFETHHIGAESEGLRGTGLNPHFP